MKKWLLAIGVLLSIAIALAGLGHAALSTETLVMTVAQPDAPEPLRLAAKFWLSSVRGFEEVPALNWLLSGCSVANTKCRDTAVWLLAFPDLLNRYDLNSGMTSLHAAVLHCEAENVRFLVENQADKNLLVRGSSKLQAKTVQQLLELVKKCDRRNEIAQLLN